MLANSSLVPGVLLFFLAAPVFAQTDLERATAREAADAGLTAYDAGHYEQAADSFSRAEQLVHAPPHLLFLARSQAKLGRLVEAHENYLKITRETLGPKAPKAFVEAHASAEQEIEAVDVRLPSVTIAVQGSRTTGVGVQMDGAELPAAMIGIPLPVDPGQHVFKASAPSAESAPVTVTLTEGGKETVILTLRATATPQTLGAAASTSTSGEPLTADRSGSKTSGLRIASYVSFGVGAVGLGLGTVFVLKSSSTRSSSNELYAMCVAAGRDDKCDDPGQHTTISSKDSDAHSQIVLGASSLIVGGVGVAAGITFLILDAGHSRGTARGAEPFVLPVVGFNSVGLVGAF